jgi:hypothetical protein
VRPTPNASAYRQSAWRFTPGKRVHCTSGIFPGTEAPPFGGTVNDNRDEKAFSSVTSWVRSTASLPRALMVNRAGPQGAAIDWDSSQDRLCHQHGTIAMECINLDLLASGQTAIAVRWGYVLANDIDKASSRALTQPERPLAQANQANKPVT